MESSTANLAFTGIATFAKTPYILQPRRGEADIAIVGIPYDAAIGYRPGTRFGPRALRSSSTRYSFGEAGAPSQGYWDINEQKRFLAGKKIVDTGDVDILYLDLEYNYLQITSKIEGLLKEGIFPVVLGGDHSISYPVFKAFSGLGPINIVHVDAHLDFKDQILGVRYGNSSPIRRMAELNYTAGVYTVGTRGIRTSEEDYRAALDRGNKIIPAKEFKAKGLDYTLSQLPDGGQYYVTIDIDSLDPSLAPGTGSPEAGGLDYDQLGDFLKGLAKKGRVLGFDLVEVNPYLDPAEVTSLVGARLIIEFLGAIFD